MVMRTRSSVSLTYCFLFCVRQITAGRGLPRSRVFSEALADRSRARCPAQTPYPVTGRGQTRPGDRSPSVRGRGSTSLAFMCIHRILQCGYERDRYLLRISVSVSRSGSCPARRPSLTTAAQTLTQPLVGASRPGKSLPRATCLRSAETVPPPRWQTGWVGAWNRESRARARRGAQAPRF